MAEFRVHLTAGVERAPAKAENAARQPRGLAPRGRRFSAASAAWSRGLARFLPRSRASIKPAQLAPTDSPETPGRPGAEKPRAWTIGVLLLGLLATLPIRAGETEGAFDRANRLYEQGQYSEAAAAYQALLGHGQVSAPLYYNLGNAWFKSGHLGRAVVAYRLAEQLDPRDPDIRANLQFARRRVYGAPGLTTAMWRRWLGRLTLNEWTLLASSLVWLWLLLLSALQIRPGLRKPLRPYRTALGVLMALGLAGAALAYHQQTGFRTAVVVVPEAAVHYGPLDESQSFYTVRDGAELAVLDAQGDWLRVADPSRRTGWLKQSQVVQFPRSALPSS
jgi:tetratricopeptide (TPR) repeat protein